MLQQGFDNRKGIFKNSGRRLEASVSYFTVEPSILIMPLKLPVYFYAGPRVGFLLSTPFTYKVPNAPEYPQDGRNPEASIKNFEKNTVSMQVGVGYDIRAFRRMAKDQFIFIVSPFITYLPSLDQNIRTIETLKLNSVRAGVILKSGWISDSN